MRSAVLDSTILISSFLTEGGLAFEILQLARAGEFQWYCTEDILKEIRRVLIEEQRIRKKYRYADEQVDAFLEGVRVAALMVEVLPDIDVIKRDPKDDKVLACALAAQAQYIVTRDKDLLDLSSYQGVEIIVPERFIQLIRQNHESYP